MYSKNLFLFLIFLLFALNVNGQPFSKEQLYRWARQSLETRANGNAPLLAEIRNPEEVRRLIAAPPKKEADEKEEVGFRGQVEAGISSTKETESEIHAAVNPRDSNNIIVAAMKFGQGLLGASLTFPIYYSRDFGQTWKLSSYNGVSDKPLTLVVGGGDPVIVFDSKGTAYLSWLTLTLDLSLKTKIALNWAVSNDGGATWKRQGSTIDEGEIDDVLNPTTGRFVDKEWLAVDRSSSAFRDNVYVAYAEINFADTTYQILVRRKPAGADDFAPVAVSVTNRDFVFTQFTSIDVDRKGTVHLTFAGATAADTTEAFGLYHTYSTDGGKTFSKPVRISDLHLPCFPPSGDPEATCPVVGIDPNRMYPCPHMRVDHSGGPNDGNLYAVWTADGRKASETEGLDIYYSRSTDGGRTWSQARVLNDDRKPASHQFFPSLAVNDGGRVIVTWYDRRGDTDNKLTNYFITTSEDGGKTFEPSFSVSGRSSDFSMIGKSNANFGVGEYTQVIATRGYALPFWADGRTNDGNIEIYSAQVALGALTTSLPILRAVTDRFAISGPNPNPATDRARVNLELKSASRVSVEIYTTSGQLAQRLPRTNLPAGEHQLDLKLRSLPAGQYLVAVRTDFGLRSIPLNIAK